MAKQCSYNGFVFTGWPCSTATRTITVCLDEDTYFKAITQTADLARYIERLINEDMAKRAKANSPRSKAAKKRWAKTKQKREL